MDEVRAKRALRKHAGLEREILQEIAEALGNAGEKVERALERLRAVADRIEALRESLVVTSEAEQHKQINERLRREIGRYHLLRREVIGHYRHLIIHREAVGFRNHKVVEEKYQIPPPLEALEE